jgi:ABC-type microcin C transport system permease subunit YejB
MNVFQKTVALKNKTVVEKIKTDYYFDKNIKEKIKNILSSALYKEFLESLNYVDMNVIGEIITKLINAKCVQKRKPFF